jgi:hypothetical protein
MPGSLRLEQQENRMPNPTIDPMVPSITIVSHRPERRQVRPRVPALAGPCCCSCCCCCLHTVGGIIGAALAPQLGRKPARPLPFPPPSDAKDDFKSRSLLQAPPDDSQSVTDNRWATTDQASGNLPLPNDEEPIQPSSASPQGIAQPARRSAVALFWWSLLCLVIVSIFLSRFSGRVPPAIEVVLFMGVIVFPALQLGAAVVTAGILAVSTRTDKGYQFLQLGKIVAGVILGSLVGLLVMLLGGGVFIRLLR